MMGPRKTAICLGVAAALMSAPPALAQDITTESLGAASAFDAGALTGADISLPSSMWQGVDSARAAKLLDAAPFGTDDPFVQTLLRAALLSPSVPPQGDRDIYEAARFAALMKLGDQAALQTFLARNPALGQSPEARADMALLQMDSESACSVSDSITEQRAEVKWARLRAVCHMLRGEGPAAELTRDLLQNRGHTEPAFFALLDRMDGAKTDIPTPTENDDALINFMRAKTSSTPRLKTARNPNADAGKRLDALWQNLARLSASDVQAITSDISFDEADLEGSTQFDFESAASGPAPRHSAQLFLLAGSGDARAIAALAQRAPQNGAKAGDILTLFAPVIASLSAADQVSADLALFAQAAINRRDLAGLSAFHAQMQDASAKNRIALAADALGNGFQTRALGNDIDQRLGSGEARAKRDAVIGLALGAQMSQAGRETLIGAALNDGRALKNGDIIALQSAAARGSIAQALFMIAEMTNGSSLDSAGLYVVISSLIDLGLYELAGQYAAQDFIQPL